MSDGDRLGLSSIERCLRAALAGSRVLGWQHLTEGFHNANFRVEMDREPWRVVLRMYQHEASVCRKELDVMRLVRDAVPVPEVIYAEPDGMGDLPPFTLARYVEGVTFRELRRSGDREAIAQAARSAGEVLATIGRISFAKGGWLSAGPAVGAPLMDGADPMPHFVDACLATANLQRRMAADWRDRVSAAMWAGAARLAELGDYAQLVHGDFNKRNVLVRECGGRWRVAAILDWEFAVAGSPLGDLANFLRYEMAERPLAEPHFSRGYVEAGGRLGDDWRHVSRMVDLVALCESLAREELPEGIEGELVELVKAAAENRDVRA